MSVPHTIRLGSRGSQLALYQARLVAGLLAQAGGPPCEIVVIKTSGDLLQTAPLSDVGGKRLFVKEIEDALLRDEIDLAVHSSKDMPADLPGGLEIAGVLPREDPHDAVVLPLEALKAQGSALRAPAQDMQELISRLGPSPSIGTSSVRRIAQLTRLLPGARFMPIRGNLDTRLRKLDAGADAALVLAAAGLRRLGFASRISACCQSCGSRLRTVSETGSARTSCSAPVASCTTIVGDGSDSLPGSSQASKNDHVVTCAPSRRCVVGPRRSSTAHGPSRSSTGRNRGCALSAACSVSV